MTVHPDWLVPDWPMPQVGALMTTRAGGDSRPPFDCMNLRDGLGDDPSAVQGNRQRLAVALEGAHAVYLNQVHGATVVRLRQADADAGSDAAGHEADAAITTEPGIACMVQVADCLPVLLAAPQGRGVAAAHAGWRGTAAGVLEASVGALCEASACAPGDLHAWIGAGIGPAHFEVGADVLAAFGASPHTGANLAGQVRFRPQGPQQAGKWLADLPALAMDRLRRAGVSQLSGGRWCTYADRSRFFSFRRERITGRMVAAIWIRPHA